MDTYRVQLLAVATGDYSYGIRRPASCYFALSATRIAVRALPNLSSMSVLTARSVTAVDLSQDGALLVSGSGDGEVRICT